MKYYVLLLSFCVPLTLYSMSKNEMEFMHSVITNDWKNLISLYSKDNSLLKEIGGRALHTAAHNRNFPIVCFLLNNEVKPNIRVYGPSCDPGTTPLETAVITHDDRYKSTNNLPVIQELIDHSAVVTNCAEDIASFSKYKKTISDYFKKITNLEN